MDVIALEVSSAAGKPPFGGIDGSIRERVTALLAQDPDTRYLLCYRLSRWRKGNLFRPPFRNATVLPIQDPLNGWLLRGAHLFHSMGIFVPTTPRRVTKLLSVHDLNAVRNLEWVRPEWHEKRSRRIADAISRADHVVTYSRFTKGEICDEYGLPEERVHAVPLGVNAAAFAPPPGAEVAAIRREYGEYAITIGLGTPRKNIPRLVEALAPLEGLRLVHVGKRSDGEAEIDAAIERHGMRERVVRLEGVPHERLVGLLAASRVCVVSSLYEGFGLTPLEAMAAGAPVVCSNAASLPEVVGEAALQVDATDVEALRSAVRAVVEDSALAARLRQAGSARAGAMDYTAAARQLRELYTKLL